MGHGVVRTCRCVAHAASKTPETPETLGSQWKNLSQHQSLARAVSTSVNRSERRRGGRIEVKLTGEVLRSCFI